MSQTKTLRQRPPKLHKQGTLDGLCGIYSAVIAFRHASKAGTTKDELERVFQAYCHSVTKWPQVLWTGLKFKPLVKVIEKACKLEPSLFDRVDITYPFIKDTPKSSKEYFARLKTLFEEMPSGNALVGMSKLDEHWLVVSRLSDKRFAVRDPGPLRERKYKDISDIHAGPKKHATKTWQLQRDELIFFNARNV